MNKQAEIQQLRMEVKRPAPPAQSHGQVAANRPGMDIVDNQKQKTLAELGDKIMKGMTLTEQEQRAFLLMNNKNTPTFPPKKKIVIDTQVTAANINQQLAPPGPDINQPPGPPGPGRDEEQVEDLLGEKNRKDEENLDNKQDEGGADGGDEDDQQDDYREEFGDHDPVMDNGKEYNMENLEGDKPLPNPVKEIPDKQENVIDFPDNIDDVSPQGSKVEYLPLPLLVGCWRGV